MTTITKKTTLLAGQIPVNVRNVLGVGDMRDFSFECDHIDAIDGYMEMMEGVQSAPVTIKREGKADEQIMVSGHDGTFTGSVDVKFALGSTFTVEMTVDPAKPQYRQGTVSASGIAN